MRIELNVIVCDAHAQRIAEALAGKWPPAFPAGFEDDLAHRVLICAMDYDCGKPKCRIEKMEGHLAALCMQEAEK